MGDGFPSVTTLKVEIIRKTLWQLKTFDDFDVTLDVTPAEFIVSNIMLLCH